MSGGTWIIAVLAVVIVVLLVVVNAELRNTTPRFWIVAVLTLPVVSLIRHQQSGAAEKLWRVPNRWRINPFLHNVSMIDENKAIYMKVGINKLTILTLLLSGACAVAMSGCRFDQGLDGAEGTPPGGAVAVPHGYMARLEQVHDGRMIGFGPFVGYYFRPDDPRDLSRLQFICFNENRFYSSDLPDGAKLYEGTAVRTTLPQADIVIPATERITPVFFSEAPEAWRSTRPEPQDDFVHFHSAYDAAGPVLTGYWLRHVAVADFTYDMGGRVGKGGPLYHRVHKGPDKDFARIVEFDRGPRKDD